MHHFDFPGFLDASSDTWISADTDFRSDSSALFCKKIYTRVSPYAKVIAPIVMEGNVPKTLI